jgi:hypothetical protein
MQKTLIAGLFTDSRAGQCILQRAFHLESWGSVKYILDHHFASAGRTNPVSHLPAQWLVAQACYFVFV